MNDTERDNFDRVLFWRTVAVFSPYFLAAMLGVLYHVYLWFVG